MAFAGSEFQQSKPFGEVQDQGTPKSISFSPSVRIEWAAASSLDLHLSSAAPNPAVQLFTSIADNDSGKLQQLYDFNIGVQVSEFNHKEDATPTLAEEKSLEDGYNWRKYGQKHVKGSEFPRSYYKCTYPNCQVKKQLESSHNGTIRDIIFKGKHDHPKPQARQRFVVGTVVPIIEENLRNFSHLKSTEDKTSDSHVQTSYHSEQDGIPELYPVTGSDDERDDDDSDDKDSDSKRRKQEFGGADATLFMKPAQEPRLVVQTLSEVDILDDGYRWRKYGQKVVKGNPNPRSYYKCTNAGCVVRKHVERACHDQKAVITTYEGKHNHDVPAALNSSHDMAVPCTYTTSKEAIIGSRLEATGSMTLDLGVGIS